MNEDLGCKAHILQPGGLTMGVVKKLVMSELGCKTKTN